MKLLNVNILAEDFRRMVSANPTCSKEGVVIERGQEAATFPVGEISNGRSPLPIAGRSLFNCVLYLMYHNIFVLINGL